MDLSWLEKTKNYLISHEGGDLYYLVESLIKMEKITYRQFLYDASHGISNGEGEGFDFALDGDYDDPNDFNSVEFYVGGLESTEMTVSIFIELMQYISDNYVIDNPTDKISVEKSMLRIKQRYYKFL
ncbi:hypothetical protein [Providencia sp. PROV259]|uniref:hypothetical protein n=1 Tax=Providencia sp. PROV259 TaxID=2949947 RepID=UPI00234AD058|nr:hypothetical protein [Providencia sp. PROV259]